MKKLMCIFAALALLLTLFGCSGSSKGSLSAEDYTNSVEQNYYESGDAAPSESVTGSDMSLEGADLSNRKMIYNADISAETKDFDEAKNSIDGLIAACGGYIDSSDISGYSYDDRETNRWLNYTARIPAKSLTGFMSDLEKLVNVTSTTMDMEDVTDSYVDTQARLNAMTKEEEKLLELLDQAATLEEILMLEDRISSVRYEIESLTARIKAYDSEIEYSTVSLHLRDVTEYSTQETFGSRAWKAFTGGWSGFVNALEELVLLLILALPFLLALGIVVVVIVLIARHSGKKRRAKFSGSMPVPPMPDPDPAQKPSEKP